MNLKQLQYTEVGIVKAVRGCIIIVKGFRNCINGQLIKFGYGTMGISLNFGCSGIADSTGFELAIVFNNRLGQMKQPPYNKGADYN